MTTAIQGYSPAGVANQAAGIRDTARQESGFLSTLQDAMGEVENLQAQAEQQVSMLVDGNGQDVHGAMIAVERADLSFQLMMQVRNKIVNAYQEIARMQF